MTNLDLDIVANVTTPASPASTQVDTVSLYGSLNTFRDVRATPTASIQITITKAINAFCVKCHKTKP